MDFLDFPNIIVKKLEYIYRNNGACCMILHINVYKIVNKIGVDWRWKIGFSKSFQIFYISNSVEVVLNQQSNSIQ